MANYPSVRISPGSNWEYIDDMIIDRSVAGNARGRLMFTSPKKRFAVSHIDISQADLDLITACYATYRGATLTFTWIDGVTYTVMFSAGGKPKASSPYGVLRYDVSVGLEEA